MNDLTKREYFAALAMQGLLAGDTKQELELVEIAELAIKQADALIKRLDEEF